MSAKENDDELWVVGVVCGQGNGGGVLSLRLLRANSRSRDEGIGMIVLL